MFSIVTARLNPQLFGLDDSATRDLVREMKEEVNIDCQETPYGFVVSGTLEKIQRSEEFLQDSLLRRPVRSSPSDTEPLVESNSVAVDTFVPQVNRSHVSEEVGRRDEGTESDRVEQSDLISSTHNYPEKKDISTIPDKGGIIEPQQFQTDPLSLRFLMHFHKKTFEDIQMRYEVDCQASSDGSSVKLIPSQDCDAEKFNNAYDQFISLYQGACIGMTMEEIVFEILERKEGADQIRYIELDLPVLIEKGAEPNRWVLFGDKASVTAAKERLKESLILEDTWEFLDDTMIYRHHSDKGGTELREIMKIPTSTGKRLLLYEGDITQLRVDAIVNPANSQLQHKAGLANAIRRVGGKRIQVESDTIVRSKGEVQVGSAVHTNAGNLPCQYVIHAVGPTWGLHDEKECKRLLSKACIESLNIATKHGVRSIAFPAISSGLFGVPIEICAEAMLDAVEEYLKAKESAKKAVSDICFVHIDDDAVEVFKNELLKRFPR